MAPHRQVRRDAALEAPASPERAQRDGAVLAFAMFVFPAFQGLMQTIVPLLLADLRVPEATIGGIQAVPGVAALLAGAPMALLANTRWRRAALLGSFGLGLAACLGLLAARDPLTLVVPQLLIGLASAAFYAQAMPSAFRLASGERQEHLQGRPTMAQGLGFFAGPLLAGYLADICYDYAYAVGAALGAAGMLAVGFLTPSRPIAPPGGLRAIALSYGRLYHVLTRRPAVLLGVAFTFMGIGTILVMGGAFFLVYARTIGVSSLVASAFLSGREALGAAARLGYAAISRRYGPVRVLGVGTLIGGVTLAFLPQARGPLGLGLIALGTGLGFALQPPAVDMLSGASAAPEEQSYATTSLNVGNFAAQSVLAPLFGGLLAWLGYPMAYALIAALWVILALLLLRVGLRLTPQPPGPDV